MPIYRKQLSAIRTQFDCFETLQGQLHELDLNAILPRKYAACSGALRAAKFEVKTIVQHSFAHREQERQRRIENLEASQVSADKKTAQMLRRLKKAEDIKQQFSKLKYARNTTQRQGVTRIEIPVHPDADPKRARLGNKSRYRRKCCVCSRNATESTSVKLMQLRLQSLLFWTTWDSAATLLLRKPSSPAVTNLTYQMPTSTCCSTIFNKSTRWHKTQHVRQLPMMNSAPN